MDIKQLRARFITATGGRKPTDEQVLVMETNRQRIFAAAQQVNTLPENRYQSMALTALEEALIWANKAVFFEPPVEDPGLGGVLEQRAPVAGPQFPGQAYPGKPIVSDSDWGRTLYTPVGPIHVGDVVEHWDTPSGPTSAETWQIMSIDPDGTVHTQGMIGRPRQAGPSLGASVFQPGGPWRVQLPTVPDETPYPETPALRGPIEPPVRRDANPQATKWLHNEKEA